MLTVYLVKEEFRENSVVLLEYLLVSLAALNEIIRRICKLRNQRITSESLQHGIGMVRSSKNRFIAVWNRKSDVFSSQ